MHLKRSQSPKTWPIARKGTKYIVRSLQNLKNGVPLLIALRDILQVAENRKEVIHILNLGKIKVNGKIIKREKYPLTLFDNLSLEDKNLKLIIKNKKFAFEEVNGRNADQKIAKIIGKTIVNGGKIQINLSDSRNYLIKEKAKVGESVIIDLKENKVEEILQLKNGSKIIFISGKHIGEEGKVEKIEDKIIIVSSGKEKINAKQESLMVIK